ncbi:MAG: c-type cytochrome, partial [Deltaproteobacteria bacterium]|nr:c-type cytochrome [Deltaproteobacteria bacterium]
MQIRLYYISISLALFATAILFSSSPLWAENETSVNELYQSHCASCHGEGRLGLMGPALLPESLERTPKPLAAKKIRDGAIATQMPAFKNTLSEEQIAALTEYIYKPLATLPSWGEKQINSSRVIYHDISQLPSKPIYQGDILNIFLAVELGDQHVSVIDGDNFSVLHRFSTRPALHGGIKYSPDGRFAYLASRDGWISIFDVYNFKTIAEVRAGINTRNIAVSRNGKYLIVGNYLPHTVVILDALTLNLLEFLPVASKDGITSRVSAVYDAGPQQSFVVALKDVPEMWEISYRHSPTKTGSHFFSTRRIALSNVLDDFFFDDDFKHILGASRTGECSVIELASGKLVKKLKLEGMPHLGSGIMWTYQGKRVMATPNLKQGLISIIDTSTWSIIKNI